MSATESAARILAMVPWLLERPGASLREVADVVGSDPETVRRELDMLCYCGGPGLGGGAMFEVSFHGNRVTLSMAPGLKEPLRLSPAEALRLVMNLSAVERVLGEQLPALGSALDKVRAAAGIDAGAVTSIVDQDGYLATLHEAIVGRRSLTLSYRGRKDDEPVERHLDPWQLELTPEGWYLHAHDLDRDDHRVFRVDRIHDVVVTDDPVAHDAPAELPAPEWSADDDAVEVELRLSGSARYLGDYVAVDVDEFSDGVRRVVFATDSLPWVAELVAAAGRGAEVVRPDELAATVREAAAAGLAAYGAHG